MLIIMTQTHKDLFSAHSADYRSFRPTYPRSLFDYLASLVSSHDVAWDVGCGNGQSSIELARHFGAVNATDISAEQLKNAMQDPRVHYSVASAEKSGLLPGSVNLITSSQAFHWFNRDNFIAEVRRVSAPQGAVVAIWCYDVCKISNELDPVIEHLYNGILKGYWEPERALVDELYASVVMPFEEIPMPSFEMTAEWSLAHLTGYFHTWSAVNTYIRKNDNDPIEMVASDLRHAFGNAKSRTVRWHLQPRAWRIDVEA